MTMASRQKNHHWEGCRDKQQWPGFSIPFYFPYFLLNPLEWWGAGEPFVPQGPRAADSIHHATTVLLLQLIKGQAATWSTYSPGRRDPTTSHRPAKEEKLRNSTLTGGKYDKWDNVHRWARIMEEKMAGSWRRLNNKIERFPPTCPFPRRCRRAVEVVIMKGPSYRQDLTFISFLLPFRFTLNEVLIPQFRTEPLD